MMMLNLWKSIDFMMFLDQSSEQHKCVYLKFAQQKHINIDIVYRNGMSHDWDHDVKSVKNGSTDVKHS